MIGSYVSSRTEFTNVNFTACEPNAIPRKNVDVSAGSNKFIAFVYNM